MSAVVPEEAAGVAVSDYQGAEDDSAGVAGAEPCVEYSSDPLAVGLDDVHAGECAEPGQYRCGQQGCAWSTSTGIN